LKNTEQVTHRLSTQDGFTIEVMEYGNGAIPLLTFHGFGRNAQDWKTLYPAFEDNYTLYAVNLFFHGKSKFPGNRMAIDSLKPKELQSHLTTVIEHFGFMNFAVAGYSLGGKIALLCAQLFPSRILEIWLFAPDGIVKNFWYKVASNTKLGRTVYAGFLEHPRLFFTTVNQVYKWGIINSKMREFVMGNMETRFQRELVRDVWLAYRFLNPDMKIVIRNIKQHEIPVYQFFGKKDSIIPPKLGMRFARAIDQESKLFVMNCGHWLFRDSVLDEIKRVQTEKG
jgi:pimeloyl-ACP methyl ester carboxylesterase